MKSVLRDRLSAVIFQKCNSSPIVSKMFSPFSVFKSLPEIFSNGFLCFVWSCESCSDYAVHSESIF